jgi:AraC-like DNA-binding protein
MRSDLQARHQHIDSMIENKLSFDSDEAQLSIYDTYQRSFNVPLSASNVLFCGMLKGKKIMHVGSCDYHHDFLPNESFVLAPNQTVHIDFPNASMSSPTTCLAIEISQDKLADIAHRLNIHNQTGYEISYQNQLVHVEHNWQTQALLDRMVQLFTENGDQRGVLIDLALNELVTRLLTQQTRELILKCVHSNEHRDPITEVIHYIEHNLSEPLDVKTLSTVACMSRSKFFSYFKSHLKMTPHQWLLTRRLAKAKMLLKTGKSITQVGFDLGFNHTSQFSRTFKNAFGVSPKAYQKINDNLDK